MKAALDALEDKLRGIEPITLPFRWTMTGSRDAPEEVWRPFVLRMVLTVKQYLDPCYGRPAKRGCPHVRPSHGAARGVDTWFDDACRMAGWKPVRFPVPERDWERFGRYAGHRRNGFMLRSELPHLCTALVHNSSRGATGCADTALSMGLPVLRYTEEELLMPPGVC